MSWVKVKSSQLHSHSYTPEDEILRVRFLCYHCGRTPGAKPEDCQSCKGSGVSSEYHYSNVDAATYGRLRDADSVGSTFISEIKKQPHKFPYRKVSP